ncbi:hypothetical protein [Sphingomonas xinjiangensis]|uniref:Uncharacterized protein n=1 Tax=Sphingomonas xinjiangensis TaxID=643568 RepID=A0A840YNL1_9SPHN|nr:hypothetical protein [Sphingomonas xinjiangensis]MBB5709451.1 hypothetical protein [Sphingomonas xinjiangensis]
MAFGFETYTPDGRRQLLDTYRYFRLETKQVLDESNWTQNEQLVSGGLSTCKVVFVPGISLADTPMVALSCESGTMARVSDVSGGINVTIHRISRTRKDTVTMYVFSTRRPPDPNYGMGLYDANGQILFSITTPIVKPLGTYENGTYTGVSMEGRTCAHVSQRWSNTVELVFSEGGFGSCSTTGTSGSIVQGYQSYRQDRTLLRLVKCIGSTISVDQTNYTSSLSPWICSTFPRGAQSSVYSIQPNYRSLVIDVTNI